MNCTELAHPASRYFTKLDDMDLEGGYGVVYKAGVTPAARAELQIDFPDIVAVKRMQLEDAAVHPVIENEIRILTSLDIPHAVKYYGCFSRRDYIYVVMEWAQGYELGEMLNMEEMQEFYLPRELKNAIALELAIGIQEFHNAGIAHRDIKVDNVMFSLQNGKLDGLKIIDYGFACTPGTCNEDLYTIDYRDPYRVLTDFNSLLSADWYAYGVTLLLLYQNRFDRRYRSGTPAFVRQLLEARPENRPTFDDIVAALRRRRSPRFNL